jgi:hypothetical protein
LDLHGDFVCSAVFVGVVIVRCSMFRRSC